MTQPHPDIPAPLTIGVFDSGFGGLTVLRALLPLIPDARFLYLGDTARLPYGSKSRDTIARYALSSANFLLDHGADLLVIACNTATALALDHLRSALSIPVVGVIEPGAQASQALSTRNPDAGTSAAKPATSHVLVLATAATVQSRAYTRALEAVGLQATEKACPLLVPLVEEGWLPTASPSALAHPSPDSRKESQAAAKTALTREVLRIYLAEAQALAPDATTLLLGCTHYPLLEPLIRQTLLDLHYPLTLVDSAEATARATQHLVARLFPHRTLADTPAQEATTTFYATDSVEKFAGLGSRFLGRPLPEVHLIDLGG